MGSQREFTKVRLKTREILTAVLVGWAIFFYRGTDRNDEK